MPALVVFGRRWNLGSDDLVYPCILETAIRVVWLIAMVVVYIIETHSMDCPESSKLRIFYVGTMAILIVCVIINITMATLSARGGIMDTSARKHVPTLLYLKMAVSMPEIVWAVLGSIWTFSLEYSCGQSPVRLAKAVVIAEWIILFTFLVSVLLMFDRLGKRHVKKRSLKDYNEMWERRCRVLCCCLAQDENKRAAFGEVTDLLSQFFRGRDYVFTDVLSGVILLSIKQKYVEKERPIVPVSEAPTLPLRSPSKSQENLAENNTLYSVNQSDTVIPEPNVTTINGVSKDGPISEETKLFRDSPKGGTKYGTVDSSAAAKDTDDGVDTPCTSKSNSTTIPESAGDSTTSNPSKNENTNSQIPHENGSQTDHPKERSTSKPTKKTPSFSEIQQTSASGNRPNVLRRKGTPPKRLSNRESWSSIGSDDGYCISYTLPRGPKSWMTLENAAHYLRYATASYGSSNHAGCYNCGERIPLCRKYRWRSGDDHLPSSVLEGDNWWECEISSILQYARLERRNIIFASLDNKIFKTPYFVMVDEQKKTVVIAIRGTMSAGDALTDLTAQGDDLKLPYAPRGNVHRGILKVAEIIIKQLDTHQITDKIPKGYRLVLTGHSLGAGVAAIMALLLRERYPNVVCYAFSPPGGLVSESLALFTQNFVFTMFLGMDVVVRLSVRTMEKLKSDLLAVIKNSRLPKYKILCSGVSALCCGWTNQIALEEMILDTKTERLTTSMYRRIQKELREDTIPEDSPKIQEQPQIRPSTNKTPSRQQSHSSHVSVSDTEQLLGDEACRTKEPVVGEDNPAAEFDLDTATSTPLPVDSRASLSSCQRQSSTTSASTVSRSSSSTVQPDHSVQGHSQKRHKKRRKRRDLKRKSHNPDESRSESIALSDSHKKWRKRQQKVKTGLASLDPLYLPGQIFYLYQDEDLSTSTCCNSEPVYRARWAKADEFDRVIIHSNMMADHNPYSIDAALQQILEQQKFSPDVIGYTPVVLSQPANGVGHGPGIFAQDSIMEEEEYMFRRTDIEEDPECKADPIPVKVDIVDDDAVSESVKFYLVDNGVTAAREESRGGMLVQDEPVGSEVTSVQEVEKTESSMTPDMTESGGSEKIQEVREITNVPHEHFFVVMDSTSPKKAGVACHQQSDHDCSSESSDSDETSSSSSSEHSETHQQEQDDRIHKARVRYGSQVASSTDSDVRVVVEEDTIERVTQPPKEISFWDRLMALTGINSPGTNSDNGASEDNLQQSRTEDVEMGHHESPINRDMSSSSFEELDDLRRTDTASDNDVCVANGSGGLVSEQHGDTILEVGDSVIDVEQQYIETSPSQLEKQERVYLREENTSIQGVDEPSDSAQPETLRSVENDRPCDIEDDMRYHGESEMSCHGDLTQSDCEVAITNTNEDDFAASVVEYTADIDDYKTQHSSDSDISESEAVTRNSISESISSVTDSSEEDDKCPNEDNIRL